MELLNTYELSLTPDYVNSWGIWEAVREIIQNALDCDKGYDITYSEGLETLTITSLATSLDKSTLLLGSSTKRSDSTTRGCYGEGYKLALLVLLCKGKDVLIDNADLLWKPSFKKSIAFGKDVLTVEEYASGESYPHLNFTIKGITPDEYEEIGQKCLHIDFYENPSKDQIHETSYGNIIVNGGGVVYSGGLFVCNEDNTHSYDIKPEHIKLDRDRSQVIGWDFDLLRARMWAEAGLTPDVTEGILKGAWEYRLMYMNNDEEASQKVIDAAIEKYGEAYFVGSQEEADNASKQGIDNVAVISENAVDMIYEYGLYDKKFENEEDASTPRDYVSDAYDQVKSELDDILSKHSSAMSAVLGILEDLCDESENWSKN